MIHFVLLLMRKSCSASYAQNGKDAIRSYSLFTITYSLIRAGPKTQLALTGAPAEREWCPEQSSAGAQQAARRTPH